MRKLFLIILIMPIMSFATSLDMSTLRCRDVKLTTITTLADVQKNCLIKEQSSSNGLFEVEFVNSETKDTVTCYFGSSLPSAILNSCK